MNVTWEGHIIPRQKLASVLMKVVLSSLSKVGLSAFPSALTAVITSRVLPVVLFGVEIWGIKESVDMLINHSLCVSFSIFYYIMMVIYNDLK